MIYFCVLCDLCGKQVFRGASQLSISGSLYINNSLQGVAWYDFDMQIAFYLPGKVPIYMFSLLLAFGSSIGLWTSTRRLPDKSIQNYFNAGVGALLGAAVLGRLMYILPNWAYFKAHLIEIPQVWLGGLSGLGALAGGLLALVLISTCIPLSLGGLADVLRPLLTAVAVSAWLGCWVEGCFYGPEVLAWWGVPSINEWGDISNRWPLQPVCALLILIIAWLIDQMSARKQVPALGVATLLEVGAICLVFLWGGILRVDPVPKWAGIAINTWLSLVILFATISTFLVIIHQTRIKPDP
jgi:prolipoprotein diacylglyceryltransferase